MSLNAYVVLSLALVGIVLSATCPKIPPPPEGFDISQIEGRWYEMTRVDGVSEDGLTCVTCDMTLRSDGNYNVTNQGYKPDGSKAGEYGRAMLVNGPGSNTVKVYSNASPIPIGIDFNIVEIVQDRYLVGVTCLGIPPLFTMRHAWILSRTPTMDADLLADLRNKLITKYNVPEKTIQVTKQDGCSYWPEPSKL